MPFPTRLKDVLTAGDEVKTNEWYVCDGRNVIKGKERVEMYKSSRVGSTVIGPFPTRGVARLYAGARPSMRLLTSSLYAKKWKYKLQHIECTEEIALTIALVVESFMAEHDFREMIKLVRLLLTE